MKFILTILATVRLLLHTQPIGLLAGLARETTTLFGADIRRMQIQLVGGDVTDRVVGLELGRTTTCRSHSSRAS